MQPVVLGVRLDPGKEMRLSMIVMSLGARYRSVRENEYDLPVGTLCGDQTPDRRMPPLPVKGEMIVMAYLTNEKTDALLKAIRESGMEPIRLKAVLTPTNREWSCGRLYQELSRERFFFKQHEKNGP